MLHLVYISYSCNFQIEKCECGTVQVDYQTKELYIVTIVLKYWKRNSNNNNDILHILLCILLLDITVLLTGTPWDLMCNGEALVYRVIIRMECDLFWKRVGAFG